MKRLLGQVADSRLLRLFFTLRYLKPVQFYGRLWFRLHRPRPRPTPPPELRALATAPVGWAARKPSLLGPERFCFLNEEGDLSRGWDDPQAAKLWRYNLHYFDDLTCAGWQGRKVWHLALIERWVRENPPGQGSGWEPYPLSLRIVNWIKWSLAGNPLESSWQQSLAMQVRHLAGRLEHHLLGNHLFVNAKALVFAGLFFQGKEADQWLAKGLAILHREIREQVLADGGHFERSPMYHALILEDLLDVLNLARCCSGAVPASAMQQWEGVVEGMRSWLRSMTHPDGEFSFFNDAACGIASPRDVLEGYALRLGLGPVAEPNQSNQSYQRLADSGFIRVADQDMVALLDVGEVGPDYLPGHAHADTLSFELSLFGQRVVVNSGTSCYGLGAERSRQRGTSAHSTVVLNGMDSSEVWGGFRVARRARPFNLVVEETRRGIEVACSHDGYRRLPGQPVHQRQWRFGEGFLEVSDRIEGGLYPAVARYHLHPAVEVDQVEGRGGRLLLPGNRTIRWQAIAGEVELAHSSYHPEFGQSLPCRCLDVHLRGMHAALIFSWA